MGNHPISGNRPYFKVTFGNRPYEAKPQTKEQHPLSGSRLYNNEGHHNNEAVFGNRPYQDRKEHEILVNDIEYIPMGNRRHYENPTELMGNRPYYNDKVNNNKHEDHSQVPMGNRRY